MKKKNNEELCSICETIFVEDCLTEFDEQYLCEECLENETVLCTHCGERVWQDDNHGDNATPLCNNCKNNHYVRCDHCERILHQDRACYEEDRDTPYCEDCYDDCCDHGSDEIKDYSYKPEPLFYGEGNRFFGIELEIDGAGTSNKNAEQLLDIANINQDLLYIKQDSSLNNGMELVTHPMTMTFHQSEMPWLALMKKAASMGYRSHSIGTCGLHLHVSRAAFGATESEQDPQIARVLYFFEKHWEELLKFSRRTESQLKRWAARYGYKDCPAEILDQAKHGYSGRYTCVNLRNYETVEFRIFRGTLKYNTLIATLQMVNAICDVAIFMSDMEVKELSWTSFVGNIDKTKYPELITYLKERSLYINEKVESEEEI